MKLHMKQNHLRCNLECMLLLVLSSSPHPSSAEEILLHPPIHAVRTELGVSGIVHLSSSFLQPGKGPSCTHINSIYLCRNNTDRISFGSLSISDKFSAARCVCLPEVSSILIKIFDFRSPTDERLKGLFIPHSTLAY